MTILGYQHPGCYARALGGCSHKISGEHYISDGVLKSVGGPSKGNPTVYGKNLAFLRPGMGRVLDIGRLTADILCEEHNHNLSGYDTAGIEMCTAAGILYQAVSNIDATARDLKITGDEFERWMLKTLCGCLYSGMFWRDLPELKGVEPPIEWLKYLYQDEKFPIGQGVYWQPYHNEGMPADDPREEVEFHPIFSETDADGNRMILGLRAWFYGTRFDLLMAVTPNISAVYCENVYHPAELSVVGCGTKICFDWADGSKRPVIELPSLGG